MRRIIFIWLVLWCSQSYAQSDSSRVFLDFGLGYSYSNFTESIEPNYGLDVFTLTRKNAVNISASLGYALNSKIDLSLNYGHNSLAITKEKFNEGHQERHPEYFIYHDFGLDETNSTPSGFRHNSILLGINYKLKTKYIKLIPRLNIGMSFWEHRNFSFVKRSSDSNFTEEFRVESHLKPTLTLSSGLRIVFGNERRKTNNLNSFFIDFSALKSNLELNYELENRSVCSETEEISFNSNLMMYTIGLGVRGLLNLENKSDELNK